MRLVATTPRALKDPRVTNNAGDPSASDSGDPREMLALIVDSAVDFAIFTFSPDGITTSWNRGAERLLGYHHDEIEGRDADVIFTPEDIAAGVPDGERRRAEREGRAENERWHVRKDGTRFWGSGLAMPLRDGNPGFVKMLRDLTERHEAQEQLRESEARFRLLAQSIPQLVFRCRPDGERVWGSPQWRDFAGMRLEESLGFGWMETVHPDDRDATLAAWAASRDATEHYSEQRVRRARDGEYRWHQTRARPLEGSDAEWVGTMTDIHELKTLAGRQAVLVAELQHRTRNLLAVVQSIAKQTMRSAGSLDVFAPEFEGRLRALSRVQGLLARVERGSIDLGEIVEAELLAHRDGATQTDRVTIAGPPVELPATSAQAVALALHELATNAVKHGALAHALGRLSVTWALDETGPERRVALEWRESGVPMPEGETPRRKGYGRELIERALPYQLRAETRLEFGPDGVRCALTVPVAADGDPPIV